MDRKQTSIQELLNEEYTWWEEVRFSLSALLLWFKDKWNHFRYRTQCFRRGYSSRDVWEMQDWFIRNAKPMLQTLSLKYYGYPPEITEEQWSAILAEMAHLLNFMDRWDDSAIRVAVGIPTEDSRAEALALIDKERQKAKERFFFLFSKWFYDL